MIDNTILKKVNEFLENNNVYDNSIIVLKGIKLGLLDESNVNIDNILKDKLGYFISIYNKRKFISYEEFLILQDFILAQYKKVYVLNNNLYMEQFFIDNIMNDDTVKYLLSHYSESETLENDETYIGDIDEYQVIYTGLKSIDGKLIGAYFESNGLSDIKVEIVNIFDEISSNISYDDIQSEDSFEICDEGDYLIFIDKLLNSRETLNIKIGSYIGDKNRLKRKISLIQNYWNNVHVLKESKIDYQYESRKEYRDILKKYWGYENFRNIKVYNLEKIESGEKEIIDVSQECIISQIVEQVEKAGKGQDFQDAFVTAPTGAGKSIIFQIPAIYLAETKEKLLTIVISPLIGLMNDQVKNLELKNYNAAKTINSDISPIVKEEVINKVSNGEYNILYISPETLLSRSDIEQLIGNRTIGMIVIDEAHIVTTWGKQFRPDYWYLGDHIRKLRKRQIELKKRSFVISTFTATAIYHGYEDMYTETINSLHMLNPLTYLGYIKRNDIDIKIDKPWKNKNIRNEYELDKFMLIGQVVTRAIATGKKTLIYFPTVGLINRCYEYLLSNNRQLIKYVGTYYGTLAKEEKMYNYESFYNKDKIVMLATKAFGMGIDINDIEIVLHFAPTGNVCDYVQEVGRVARKENLYGEALYHYNTKDFKHINRLHGMSVIKKYQIIEVIKKITELYRNNLVNNKKNFFTKKRNALLLDAENFTYIFENSINDEDNSINKVKTALLLIQKDFESRIGFSPINMRPIPMFASGYFEIDKKTQVIISKKYPGVLKLINEDKKIYEVALDVIWKQSYGDISFPNFKYLIYSKSQELDFSKKYLMNPVLCVEVNLHNDYDNIFETIWTSFKKFVNYKIQTMSFTSLDEIVEDLHCDCRIDEYKARAIFDVILASIHIYQKSFSRMTSSMFSEMSYKNGLKTQYRFNTAINSYFKWVEDGFFKIKNEKLKNRLYLVDTKYMKNKEVTTILGILESMGVLTFEMIGGANSQIYIYLNQMQALKNIINYPGNYHNKLLETVNNRHTVSVNMLKYIYENEFSSKDIWNILEDYFLGIIPQKVIDDVKKDNINIDI